MAQRSPHTRFLKIDQSAAGTDTLIAADADYKIVVKGIQGSMGAAGTVKLVGGTTDLTGAMPVAANGGFVIPPVKDEAYTETLVNEALKITTTGGAFKGMLQYELQK
jgi:hypothetical protein